MRRCPYCAAEVLGEASACRSCGSPLAVIRRRRWVPRTGLALLVLLLPAAAAVPAYRSLRPRGCEPRGWIDWHLAMGQQCLTSRYVCDNMTTPHLLEDPELAAAYRAGVAAGAPEPIPMLSEMVDRMRRSYGCKPEAAAPDSASRRQHPERRSAGPFDAPRSITL